MPVVEQAEEGHFGGLHLKYIKLQSFQGVNWEYEVYLEFPTPQSLGGEYYTIEKSRYDGDWETITNDGTPFHATGGGAFTPFYHGYVFRLMLHGGDKDGWVSNEVTCNKPSIPTNIGYQAGVTQSTFVGSVVYGSTITARVYHDINDLSDYTNYSDESVIVRTWYRRNPNTGAMTSTGYHDKSYTITIDDVGYEIVEVVEGDRETTDFYYEHTCGIGMFPISCSAEFFYDGFIVNSEYIIPNPQAFFGIYKWNENTNAYGVQPFDASDFRELAPGRYAFIYPWDNYCFGEEVYSTFNHFGLCEMHGTYSQQFRLWCAPGNVEAAVLKNGEPVEEAKINVMQSNMDGRMQYVYSTTEPSLMTAAYITHYAKAVEVGEGYLPTYFPNALLWTDAQSFNMMEMYQTEEGPYPINIEVRPDFAPLNGQCTIEGRIDGTVPVPTPLITMYEEAPSIIGTWNLYMTDDEGNPIHTEDMLRVKLTFNEDGTFVMSIPVWGEEQSGNWSWWTTNQTIQFQVTKIVGRNGTYEGDALVEYVGGDSESDRLKFRQDISFDAKGNLIMDIFGLENCLFEPEGGGQSELEDEVEPVYVYLRQQGGDIVAATLMQADGSYSFQQVPFGTYEVIPNIDGYDVDIQSVTLSSDYTKASSVDYAIGNYVLRKAGAPTMVNEIRTTDTGSDSYYDLTGRRVTKPTRGIYIHNGKKRIVK